MGVVVREAEVTSAVPAEKMFKALAIDCDHVLPKVHPHVFKSIETLEGDGSAGTIKKVNFTEAAKFTHVKEKIDVLDKEKLVYHYTSFEGDALEGKFEKIVHELKFEPKHDGGCVAKKTTKFFVIGDAPLDEDKLKAGDEKMAALFKAVEAHCLAN